MSDTKDRLKKVLNDLYVEDMPNITVKSKFKDDLGLDSLDEQELIMDLEDEFDIIIYDEEALCFTTVQDVIDIVNTKQVGNPLPLRIRKRIKANKEKQQ